jgi:hypothetical protein
MSINGHSKELSEQDLLRVLAAKRHVANLLANPEKPRRLTKRRLQEIIEMAEAQWRH